MAAKRGNFLGASTLMTSLFSTELDQRFQRSSMLLSTIKRALESEDELYLVFQPLVAVASGVCQAAEALLRWSHPVLGEVSPAEFIPLIENTPMARTLTAWVGRRSVRQAALWHGQVRRLRISINVSATNLVEADFAERGLAELHRARLPAEAIKLEVTESALIDKEQAIDALDRVLGLRLARELTADRRQGQALPRQQGLDAGGESKEASTMKDGG